MSLLATLLRGYGSARALALALNVSAATVRRWQKYGVPKNAEQTLKALQSVLADAKKQQAAQKATFFELLKLAGESFKLPITRTGSFKRAGAKTVGVRHTKAVARILTDAVHRDIMSWVESIKRAYPIWQGVIVVSQYGKGQHWGEEKTRVRKYTSVFFQFPHPATGDFSLETEAPTPRTTSKTELIPYVNTILNEMMNMSSRALVFIHSVTVFNYRYRTEEQRRAYLTQQRRERERARIRRQKRNTKKVSKPRKKPTKKPKSKRKSKKR